MNIIEAMRSFQAGPDELTKGADLLEDCLDLLEQLVMSTPDYLQSDLHILIDKLTAEI